MSNFSLTGKTVIVTGGAGRLGRAMVTAYAQAGANVVVASRNQEKIEAEAAKIREKGQSTLAIAVDISNEEQVDNLIAQTVDAFGTLDVIVNNAGRWGRSHLAEDTPLDEWRDVIDQNLTGMFIPCLHVGQAQHQCKLHAPWLDRNRRTQGIRHHPIGYRQTWQRSPQTGAHTKPRKRRRSGAFSGVTGI